jgi:hypothetical protein
MNSGGLGCRRREGADAEERDVSNATRGKIDVTITAG